MGSQSRPGHRSFRGRLLAAAVGGLLLGGSMLGVAPGAYAAAATPTAAAAQLAEAARQPLDSVELMTPARRHHRHHHLRHKHHSRHHRHHHRGHHHRHHINLTRVRSRAIAHGMIHSPAQFSCFSHVIQRESAWNPRARNRSSGAYGIPQALPARKLATAGADWRTNPRTQIRWAIRYMHQRYTSPCGAWHFWRHHHWY